MSTCIFFLLFIHFYLIKESTSQLTISPIDLYNVLGG